MRVGPDHESEPPRSTARDLQGSRDFHLNTLRVTTVGQCALQTSASLPRHRPASNRFTVLAPEQGFSYPSWPSTFQIRKHHLLNIVPV